MEPYGQSGYDYRQPKKMKKRKELNALVDINKIPTTFSDQGPKKIRTKPSMKNGNYDYLINSDSSNEEIDDLNLRPMQNFDSFSLCGCRPNWWLVCLSSIGFLSLAACFIMCIGLFFMHFSLRADLNHFRTQTEEDSKHLMSFGKLTEKLSRIDIVVKDVKSLGKLKTNITELSLQIDKIKESLAKKDSSSDTKSISLGEISQKLATTLSQVGSLQKELGDLKVEQQKVSSEISVIKERLQRFENISSLHQQITEQALNKSIMINSLNDNNVESSSVNITSFQQTFFAIINEVSNRVANDEININLLSTQFSNLSSTHNEIISRLAKQSSLLKEMIDFTYSTTLSTSSPSMHPKMNSPSKKSYFLTIAQKSKSVDYDQSYTTSSANSNETSVADETLSSAWSSDDHDEHSRVDNM